MLSAKELEQQRVYGMIVYRSDKVVVRVKEENGELNVYVHGRANDREYLPRGYMLGHNALTYPIT